MKYPYMVVRNGVKYRAGEEVPEESTQEVVQSVEQEVEAEEKPVENDIEQEVETKTEEPVADPEEEVAKLKAEYKPVPQYNKNTINRMSVADLRTVAKESGIKDVVEKTGAQLKRELIELFGL